MPDVKLPNGAIIRNVPEGTTREQIKAKAIAAGLATESDFTPAQPKPDPVDYGKTQTSAEALASEQGTFDAFAISMGINPTLTMSVISAPVWIFLVFLTNRVVKKLVRKDY